MAFPLLLPLLLGGAEPRVITTGHVPQVEQALSDEVKARVTAGWSLIDVRTMNDELVVTLQKQDSYERHVVHFDRLATYRVEADVKAPADVDEPGQFLIDVLASPSGGIEIDSACGEYYVRPYLVDEHSTGEFATSLIARALVTAANVTNATPTDDGTRFTFGLVRKQVARDLVVWLDPKGGVIEAQLRRFEYGGSGTTYDRMPALKKSLAKTRVTAIRNSTLVTPKGRFTLDPDGSAFSYDEGEHGCGC